MRMTHSASCVTVTAGCHSSGPGSFHHYLSPFVSEAAGVGWGGVGVGGEELCGVVLVVTADNGWVLPGWRNGGWCGRRPISFCMRVCRAA